MEYPAIYEPCPGCKGTGVEPSDKKKKARCMRCLGNKDVLTAFGEDLRSLIRTTVDEMSFAHTWDIPE